MYEPRTMPCQPRFFEATMDKRLTPPPTIHGEVYPIANRKGVPGFALNLRTHEGEPFRMWARTRGQLRRSLFYFRTLNRSLVNAVIPPGPSLTPKTAKPTKRPVGQRHDVPETLRPSMSLRERIEARKATKTNLQGD